MKQANPLATGMTLIGLFSAAACSHKVATVDKPANITPVATASSRPAATPSRDTGNAPAAPVRQAAAQPSRPTVMPKAVRDTLNDRLSHLEDALFDYDQSTIRSDASVALRDDVNVIRGILADYPNQKLIIEGHADERGSAEYNLALGDRRAHAGAGIPVLAGHSRTSVGRGELRQGKARVHRRIGELLAEESSRACDRCELARETFLYTLPERDPAGFSNTRRGFFFRKTGTLSSMCTATLLQASRARRGGL